ncbi:MAG: MoxR family ATPase [Magnetococcales bacterium]|nr:MoxR family ATPase [Magnetococcales bacterium]
MNTYQRIELPKDGKFWVKVTLATGQDRIDDQAHLLGVEEIHAINAAIASGRPLLVRGEPGTGKSQMARAAAKLLNRAFVRHVVDSHTESRDLLWQYDAVHRLAEAQLAGALRQEPETIREGLSVSRFIQPGPMWWAFDWQGALEQARHTGTVAEPEQLDGGLWKNGSVLLLDEIDKAETEVPNGLLEVLGNRCFTPKGIGNAVRMTGNLPLVIITTNEERTLPDPFLRRCLVLFLELPEEKETLLDFLVERGQVHFPKASATFLREAAGLLYTQRRKALDTRISPLPGQAEYLDLLRAVLNLTSSAKERDELLKILAGFTLNKNRARPGSA